MVHLTEIGLEPARLEEQVAEGLVRAQTHPTLPLKIYNYTEKVQFNRWWNDYTLACRGLVLDHDYNVLARPWKKFFNLGEGFAEFDWDSPVEVTDKMDGSLGILYRYPVQGFLNGVVGIATRGSFDSDQSRHANEVWVQRYSNHPDMNWAAVNDFTFLFEIIYPNNRIVLNYDGLDDLVMLGAVNIQYGYYLGPQEAAALLNWQGPVTEVFEYRTLQEAFSNNDRANAEGYVVRSGNKMVKLKQADYVELHRIVTNLNERTIWEMLASGQKMWEICDGLPDEFHQFVVDTASRLQIQVEEIREKVVNEYVMLEFTLGEGYTRKDFALEASKSPYRAYLFAMLDGKSIERMLWQDVKPVVSKE